MGARIRLGQRETITAVRPNRPQLGEIPDEALAAVRDVSAALTAAGIVHWLTYGALLGLVREGRLLPHDTDIDFCVPAAEAERLGPALAPARFQPTLISRIGNRPGNYKFERGRVAIDIYPVIEDGAVWRDHYAFDRYSVCSGTHLRMALTPLEVGGFSVPAPADREAYVAHLYGPGWRVPVTKWNWRLSPPNSTISLHWRSLPRLLAVLWLRWMRS